MSHLMDSRSGWHDELTMFWFNGHSRAHGDDHVGELVHEVRSLLDQNDGYDEVREARPFNRC